MPEQQTRAMAAAERLTKTTDEILAEVQQLPPELIHWVPAEGVWTVMDNLCHIREFVPFWTAEALRIVRRLGRAVGPRPHRYRAPGRRHEHSSDIGSRTSSPTSARRCGVPPRR